MFLEQVIIKNFRLFENFVLKLNPGVNLLVGENDSGKTAFIDAIRYTLNTNLLERCYLQESDFYENGKFLSIQLKFVDVDKYAHIFIEHLTYEKSSKDENKKCSVLYVQLSAQITDQEKRGYPFIKTEIKSGKDGNGLILDSEIRNFLTTTYLKPLRDAEAELTSGKASRLSQILNSSKEIKAGVDNILKIIAKANSELLSENLPIDKTSKKIQDAYLHQLIFEEDKKLLKAIIDIVGVKDDKFETLSISEKKKYLRRVLEMLTLSLTDKRQRHGLGYNNILFMAAELLLLEQELDSEFPLLLIEEPEAHLHPQLQMKLLKFILDKSKKEDDSNGIQCILSTHSPNLASKADPKNIIILHKGKAFSLRPEETELSGDDYKFLYKFLDASKANLFFSRGVILVEGDSENILIPTIAKLLGRPLEDYGVSIINVGSTAWKRFAKIFLRKKADKDENNWTPIKVAVLCDLDLWPWCAEDKEGNEYGFIKRNDKNEKNWLSTIEAERTQQIEERTNKLKKDLEKQNIKIFLSEHWTFEYCLSYFGLFEECLEVIDNGKRADTANLLNKEIKSTYILREIQRKKYKTEFALQMAVLLEEKCILPENKQKLSEILPPYIVNAIGYVTEEIGSNTKDVQQKISTPQSEYA